MRVLTAAELLTLWEYGVGQSPAQWALSLLVAANPDLSPDSLAQISVGWRDSFLLTLREWLFGPQLDGLITCPGCKERLELTFEIADMRIVQPIDAASLQPLRQDGYDIDFRLPNSLDLIEASTQGDTVAGRQLILQRCLLTAAYNGQKINLDQIPADVIDAVITHMSACDPQADVQLMLVCPACKHHWPVVFDIVSYLWEEINIWVGRILQEVHLLASAYGWREADILAMSTRRRQLYLAMVGG